jgi:hypothetical protein
MGTVATSLVGVAIEIVGVVVDDFHCNTFGVTVIGVAPEMLLTVQLPPLVHETSPPVMPEKFDPPLQPGPIHVDPRRLPRFDSRS